MCELTWNTFRDHLILEYEIPKYDGDFGSPNVFVPLTESLVGRKVETILAHFASQRDRRWFTEDLFRRSDAHPWDGVRTRPRATPRRSTAGRWCSPSGRRP